MEVRKGKLGNSLIVKNWGKKMPHKSFRMYLNSKAQIFWSSYTAFLVYRSRLRRRSVIQKKLYDWTRRFGHNTLQKMFGFQKSYF